MMTDMDSTPRHDDGATPVLTRRRLLTLMAAALLPDPRLLAGSSNVPARIALVYDFAAPFAAGIAGGLRTAFEQHEDLRATHLRDVDLALIDAAMTADAQRPANLVIGIGDQVAQAFAARLQLFTDGHAWVVGVRGDPADMNQRRIEQYLLRLDYHRYLLRLRALLPDCRRIGVLHGPHLNGELSRLKHAVDELGMHHECIKISRPSEIDAGIRHIAGKADVLFGMQCEHIYNDMTLRGILSQTFAMRLPMIGLDNHWVRAGALLSMDWDSDRLGYSYADQTLSAWRHDDVGVMADRAPDADTAGFYVNLQAAAHFGISGLPQPTDSAVVRYD